MKRVQTYRVKDVARIAGVSVRTLHYYEEIGLLVPATRSDAGYRLYDTDDLLRLQQILIGRELGLPLAAIQRSLDGPAFDQRRVLQDQRRQLLQRAKATDDMIRAVDRVLAALDDSRKEGDIDMASIFEGFDPSKYEAEAKARWGHTDAYKESAKRTKDYDADDWRRIKDEQDTIYRDAAAAMQAGRKPGDSDVMDIAERHRLSIERWFYPCNVEMHRNLADLYESDSRFAATIDKHGQFLTPFLAAAIRANATRGGA